MVPRLLAKSGTACAAAIEMVEAELIAPESPAKRKLRMSVSCDNYLGDGKFSLSRRDSVGSGSPHSSKVKAFLTQNQVSCFVAYILHISEMFSLESLVPSLTSFFQSFQSFCFLIWGQNQEFYEPKLSEVRNRKVKSCYSFSQGINCKG